MEDDSNPPDSAVMPANIAVRFRTAGSEAWECFGTITDGGEAQRWMQPALNDLAVIIGFDEALQLARDHGGKVIYVPPPERISTSVLTSQLGETIVGKLAEHFSGCKVEVPLGTEGSTGFRRRIGVQMLNEGRSISEVAHTLRVARSTVKDWIRRLADPEARKAAAESRRHEANRRHLAEKEQLLLPPPGRSDAQ